MELVLVMGCLDGIAFLSGIGSGRVDSNFEIMFYSAR